MFGLWCLMWSLFRRDIFWILWLNLLVVLSLWGVINGSEMKTMLLGAVYNCRYWHTNWCCQLSVSISDWGHPSLAKGQLWRPPTISPTTCVQQLNCFSILSYFIFILYFNIVDNFDLMDALILCWNNFKITQIIDITDLLERKSSVTTILHIIWFHSIISH